MARMGHSSTRAAIIYQHTNADRNRVIPAALDELLRSARLAAEGDGEERTGT
jgi:hypothetical protein